jgi:hypothetical protein
MDLAASVLEKFDELARDAIRDAADVAVCDHARGAFN